MSAYPETTSTISEFAGDYKVAVVEVNPDAQTGSVTIDELTVLKGVVASFKDTTTANCTLVMAAVDGSTTNQVNVILLKADGSTAADTAYVDFYLIAVGY